MSPRLELQRVVKRFGETTAVAGLSLALQRGEFVSLLGPSGCGKSTTLAMIAGFLEPDEGDILVDGRSVLGVPTPKRRIGLVFQDYAVFTRLTVADNLAFGLEAQRVPRAERRARVAELASQIGLAPLLARRGGSLNMSEMQRVALARALVTRPELLLLDEPMSNLDAALRASLRGELKQIQKELAQSVLYVTHDQVEAMTLSDRIAIMRAGRLLQVASPAEIYDRPANRFVAEFIGDPPINLLPCEIRLSAGQAVADTALHRGLPLGRRRISPGRHWLAVRPHVFRAAREAFAGSAPARVRFLENFGAEHVLHLQYGEDLVRVVVPPGFAAPDELLQLGIDLAAVHLIERESEARVPPETEAAHVSA